MNVEQALYHCDTLNRALRKVYKTRIGYKSSGSDQLLKLNKDEVVVGKFIVTSFKSS